MAITWTASIASASHCVGFTLPGMIEEPGSFAGIFSSANPARGPQDSNRTSLAILNSDTANVFRVALNCTRSSCAPWTVNLFGAVTKGSPRELADLGGDVLIKAW